MTDKDESLELKPGFVEEDPAEFLLSNSKYHDCVLTVGNPETDKVEKIGVSSTHLIANSTVFRDMLADSKLADPSGSNTHITDVSPATFKLMLRHIYGSELPTMTREDAAELALCADKYNIQRLMRKAGKRLKPTNVEEFFIAFMCAVYISYPDLELQVSKIVQQETEKIVQHPSFLELDENCILFLVRQTILNINELELWNNLIRWGENQVQKHSGKSLRACLHKVLPYIRFLSLTLEDITKHVLPTKVLTPDEFMDLTMAISQNETIQSPGICCYNEKRLVYKENVKQNNLSPLKSNHVFKPSNGNLHENECKEFSTMTIVTTKTIEIESFMFKSIKIKPNNDSSFRTVVVNCNITIYGFSKGLLISSDWISIKVNTSPNLNITLPVKKSNGQPLILEADKRYTLKITTSPPLPVHKLVSSTWDCTHATQKAPGMSIKFEDLFHILEIAYRVEGE